MYEAYIYRRSDTKQERDRVRFRSRKSSYPQGILRIAYEMARDNKSKAIAIDSLYDGVREPIQTAYWDRDSRFVKYHRTGRYKDNTINRLMSDGTVRLLEYGSRQYSRNELPPGCNKCVNNYITYNKTVINKPAVVKKKVVKKRVVKRVGYRSGGSGGGSGGYDLGYAGAYRLPPQAKALPTRTVRTQDTTQVQLQREARLQEQAELKKMRLQDKQERRKSKQERKQAKAPRRIGQAEVPKQLPEGVIDVDYRIIEDEPKRENMRLPSQREMQAKLGLPMPKDADLIDEDYRIVEE